MLSETDILQAVRQHIAKRGEALKVGLPVSGEITWHSLLEGTVVRCIETRTEDEQIHRGRLDLSAARSTTGWGVTPLPHRRISPSRRHRSSCNEGR